MNCYNCLWVTSLPHRISKFVSSLLSSSSSSPLIRRPRYGLAEKSVVSHDRLIVQCLWRFLLSSHLKPENGVRVQDKQWPQGNDCECFSG